MFFVVLLTLVFSFLGTIVCAVLAGMMMGATKPSRWLSVPMSLLFPAIVFSVLLVTKADLLPQHVALVSALCFAAFWGTYLAAMLMMVFERKQGSLAATPAGAVPNGQGFPVQAQDSARQVQPLVSPDDVIPARLHELNLDDLQGTWLRQPAGANGESGQSIIEIKKNKLVLSLPDCNGRPRVVAEGEIRPAVSSAQSRNTNNSPRQRAARESPEGIQASSACRTSPSIPGTAH